MNKALTPAELSQMGIPMPLGQAIAALSASRDLGLAHLAGTYLSFPRPLTLAHWASTHLRVTPSLANAFAKVQSGSTILANEGGIDEDELLVLIDEFHTIPHFLPTLEAMIRKKKGETGRKASPLGGKSFFLRDEFFSLALIEDFKDIYASKRDENGVFRPATQSAFDKAMARLLAKHRDEPLPLLRLLYTEWTYNRVFGAFFVRMESPDLINSLLDPIFDQKARSGLLIQEAALAEMVGRLNSKDRALASVLKDEELTRALDDLRGPLQEQFSIEVPSPVRDVPQLLSLGLRKVGFLRLIEDHVNAGREAVNDRWIAYDEMDSDYHDEIFDLELASSLDQTESSYLSGAGAGRLLDTLTLDNAYRLIPYLGWVGLRDPMQVAASIASYEHRTGRPFFKDIWDLFANPDQIADFYERAKDVIRERLEGAREEISHLQTIGMRAKYARKAAGLAQDRLAEAAGVTRSTVSWWETGRSKPSHEAIEVMAELYQVSEDWLVNGVQERASPAARQHRKARQAKVETHVTHDTPEAASGPIAPAAEPAVEGVEPAIAHDPEPSAAASSSEPEPLAGEAMPAEAVRPSGPRLSLAARTLSDTWNNTLTMLVEKAGAARAGDDGIRDPDALLSSLDELRTALMGTSALYAAAIRPVDVGHLLSAAAHIVLESAEIFDEDELVDVPAAGTAHPDDVPAIEAEVASAQDETHNFSRHLAASKDATEEASRLVLTKQAPARDRAAAEGTLAIRHATLALDAIRRALGYVTPTILAPAMDETPTSAEPGLSLSTEAPIFAAASAEPVIQPAGFLDMVMTEADKLIDEAILAGDLPLAAALSAVAMRLSIPMESPYSQPLLAVALLSGSIEQEQWINARVEALAAEAVDLVTMHDPASRPTQVAWTMLALAASEGALFSPHSVFSAILTKAKPLDGFAAPLAKIAFAISQVPGKLAARMSPTLIKHVETTAARSPDAIRKDIQDEMSGLLATMRAATINHVPCNQIRAHLISSGLFAQIQKVLMAGRKLSPEILAEVAEIDADTSAKLNAIGRDVCGTDDLQGSLRTTLEAKLKSLAGIANRWQETFDSAETMHARAEISSLSARFREACADLVTACEGVDVGAMSGVMQKWIARLETLSTGSAGRPDALQARDAYRAKINEAAILLGVEVSDKEAKIMANMLFGGSAY